ncbi:MAG TPA: DMT family transporter [Anaeromyxobacteraceae bacterium]|nr:DMT family transporter [Anaeromyxobacteraceae bacterium]
MPVEIAAVVLLAALLHAAWNAMVGAGEDRALDTVLVATGGSLVAAAMLPFLPLPARASWPYALASVAIHTAYFTALVGAYKAGAFSPAYTLMRGTAPALTALGGWVAGERLGGSQWLGVLLVSGGVAVMGTLGRRAAASRRATAWALSNAVVIAAYTLVDGRGVRLSGHAPSYTLWVFFLDVLPLLAWTLATRGREAARYAARRWRRGLAGGALMVSAYALVLWSMTRAPVAAVAALRETSVVFAALIGARLLKEPFGAARIAAAAVVAAGAALLEL